MPSGHLDVVVIPELRNERDAVVPAVADQSFREIGEKPEIEGGRDEVRLIQ